MKTRLDDSLLGLAAFGGAVFATESAKTPEQSFRAVIDNGSHDIAKNLLAAARETPASATTSN